MDLSLEELMNIPVYSASKFPQKKSDAPAAVTVITAQDIKDFGYRTLGDILKSVRGLYVDYDRSYTYLGVNGFRRPGGDYNGKVLLLIDGYRVNEVVYDQASLGTDFLLDPELIDRVEFVPGAGSSVYGSNAFLGVINVITHDGKAINGVEAAGQFASYGTDKERLSFGQRFANGLDAVISASHYASNGQNLFFPEFNSPATNNGVAQGMDQDRADRLFGKLSYGSFTLEAGFVNRKKFVPTGSYDTTFNQSPSYALDQQFFADLRFNADLNEYLNLFAHLYYGRYDYASDYPYIDARSISINRDETYAQWAGAEYKLISTHFDRHKLVFGGEYQNNYQQDQLNFDITAPFATYTDALRHSYRFGFYGQDEFTLSDKLILNVGLRDDYYSTFGNTINPRIGLIYHPWEQTALKFLYGTAFRAPNAYELFYSSPQFKSNPNLGPEKIRSYEIVAEHQANGNLRLTATGHRYLMNNLISQATDPRDGLLMFQNLEQIEGWGADFEVEHRWDNGTRLRASYSWSKLRDTETGARIVNSPAHLAKLNLSSPIWQDRFRLGLDAQYIGDRLGKTGKEVAGFPVFNLTLTSDQLLQQTVFKGLEVSASVYNLFDKQYAIVAGEEHRMNSILQDGRNFRVLFTYRY